MSKPSLMINAISNWIAIFIQIIIGFFLTPFIIKYLDQTGYGVWILVSSFVGYYGLLNLGVASAITRYIARFTAQNNIEELNRTANTALFMFCGTGLTAILISFVAADWLAQFFQVNPGDYNEFKKVIWILGVATGLTFPVSVFTAIITARERYVSVNCVNIIVTLIRTGLVIAILLAGYGLVGIAYPTLASAIISLVIFYYLTRKIVPEFKIQLSSVSRATLKMLVVYGGFTTIIAVADIFRMKIDSIVIGKMIGIIDVGQYGIAALLIQYMLKLVASGMSVLAPRFASLDGADKHKELKETFITALSVSSFLAFGVVLMMQFFGESFILIWVGKDFSAAIPVLLLLSISYAFALSQTPGIGLMYALNKHRYYAIANLIEAVANIVISIILAPKYGIIGVALGTVIPMAIMKLFVQPIYVSRIISIRLRDYVKPIMPSFIIAFIMVFLLFMFKGYFNQSFEFTTYFGIAFCAILIGLIYIILNCIVSKPLKKIVISIVGRIFKPNNASM